jgi:hypothetical protein
LPYIFDLYLLYIKLDEDENKYIRDNINEEEAKYLIDNKNPYNNNNSNKSKSKTISKIKTINSKNDMSAKKRERMITFSKSVKNKTFKKLNNNDSNKNNNKNIINQIKIENNYKKQKLKDTIFEIETIRDSLKDFINKHCIKENELKNLMKMKEDNIMLNEEIINIKNTMKELKNFYEYQLEKYECLKNEQNILEKENMQLIEYINKKLFDEGLINNNDKNINDNDYVFHNNSINQNFNQNSISGNNMINITPDNFESIEMFKRLNKL